jgi:hypothetical protein
MTPLNRRPSVTVILLSFHTPGLAILEKSTAARKPAPLVDLDGLLP